MGVNMPEELELDELGKPKKKPAPVKPVETESDRDNSAKRKALGTGISMLGMPAAIALFTSMGTPGFIASIPYVGSFIASVLGIQSSITASGALFFGGLLGGSVFGVFALVILPLVLLAIYNLYKGNAFKVTKNALITLLLAAVAAVAVAAVCYFWLIPTFFPVAAALLLPISLGIAIIPMLAVLYWKRENIIALWNSISDEPIKTVEKVIGIGVIVVGILAATGIIALPAAFILSPAIIIFVGLILFAGVPSLLGGLPIAMKNYFQSMKEKFSPSSDTPESQAIPVPANAPTATVTAAPDTPDSPAAAATPSSPQAAAAAAANQSASPAASAPNPS